MIIHINKQLEGKTSVELTSENFPRLFNGDIRVRNISIIHYDNIIDVQAVCSEMAIRMAIQDYRRENSI